MNHKPGDDVLVRCAVVGSIPTSAGSKVYLVRNGASVWVVEPKTITMNETQEQAAFEKEFNGYRQN